MTAGGAAEVTVQIDGVDVVAGSLWTHQGRVESATFAYDPGYLRHPRAYPLDPALPLVQGSLASPPGAGTFNAFADSAPDRWGRTLLRRAERRRAKCLGETPRSLREADYVLGVRDDVR